jgi:ribosomal protein S18 acetylase RimI-like enzyme
VLHGTGVSCRVLPWSFQPTTAQLVLYHQSRLPSHADLDEWAHRLQALGYTRVRTTALNPSAGLRAEAAGYQRIQELVLLEHRSPERATFGRRGDLVRTRRLSASEHGAASTIDLAAFGDQWALEPYAIDSVCTATPRSRVRGAGSPLAGYAISGRDAKQGFLQRLAVHPDQQRHGIGLALVHDSLQWLARWRVRRVLVNTPVDNAAALELYRRAGFTPMSERLGVYQQVFT